MSLIETAVLLAAMGDFACLIAGHDQAGKVGKNTIPAVFVALATPATGFVVTDILVAK